VSDFVGFAAYIDHGEKPNAGQSSRLPSLGQVNEVLHPHTGCVGCSSRLAAPQQIQRRPIQ